MRMIHSSPPERAGNSAPNSGVRATAFVRLVDLHGPPRYQTDQPLPGRLAHGTGLRQLEPRVAGRVQYGAGQWVLRVSLQGGDQRKHFPLRPSPVPGSVPSGVAARMSACRSCQKWPCDTCRSSPAKLLISGAGISCPIRGPRPHGAKHLPECGAIECRNAEGIAERVWPPALGTSSIWREHLRTELVMEAGES